NPPLNLRYSNDVRSKDGTGTFSFRTRPLPEFFIGQATVDVTGIVPIDSRAQGFVVWDARDWKDNRAQSWHLTLEREVMHDTSLRLSYIGDHGRDLEQRFSVNTREAEFNYQARTGQIRPSIPDVRRVNPNWNFFQAVNHTGYSNTNSFQAEVERRYSNGLAFQ